MIAVEHGPEGRTLAGRTAEGYFELLFEWIGSQRSSAAARGDIQEAIALLRTPPRKHFLETT